MVCCRLRHRGGGSTDCGDDVQALANEICHKRGQPVVVAVRISVLNRNVSAFRIAGLAEALSERGHVDLLASRVPGKKDPITGRRLRAHRSATPPRRKAASGLASSHVELGRLHHRQLAGLFAPENSRGIKAAGLAIRLRNACAVAHEAAGRGWSGLQKRWEDCGAPPARRVDRAAKRKTDRRLSTARRLRALRQSRMLHRSRRRLRPSPHRACEKGQPPRLRLVSNSISALGLLGFTRKAITAFLATSSCRIASRLASNWFVSGLTPVTLPPGRFRLATRPSLTGSPPVDENDRDRRCRRLGREHGRRDGTGRDDHGHLPANQIGRQRRQPIILTVRPAVFDRDVLALDIAGFAAGPGGMRARHRGCRG